MRVTKMMEFILANNIPDPVESRAQRKAAKGSGAQLIRNLYQEAIEVRSEPMKLSIQNKMTSIYEAGMQEKTIEEFNLFYNSYKTQNQCLIANDGRLDPAQLASRLVSVVGRNNDRIADRIDARRERLNAVGDLDKTVKIIKSALNDAEIEAEEKAHLERGGKPRALAAGADPRQQSSAAAAEEAEKQRKREERKPKIGPDGKPYWHEGMMACKHCGKRGHLNADCNKAKKKAAM